MRGDRDDRNDRPKSPIKWIILITVVLLIGVAVQSWMGGATTFGPPAGSGPWGWGGSQVVNNNNNNNASRQDVRALTGFNSVMLQGTATLDVKIGSKASVSLDGDAAVLKATRTRVHGGTLVIQRRNSNWFWGGGRGKLVAHITVPWLNKLDVHGTGNVTITGATRGASRITISGTGHVTAEGKLNAVTLIINGTGDADFSAMPVDAATVVVNGAGHVQLDVHNSLKATVNGAGDVVYSGEPPHVVSNVHGVGSVRRSGTDGHSAGQST
jgi:hypothetical protein